MVTGLQRFASLLVVMFLWAVVPGCGGGGDSPPPQGGDTKSVPTVSFPMKIEPVDPPRLQCGDPSVRTQAVIQKLNSFWGSKVRACACGNDVGAQCQANAFVRPPTFGSKGFGYGYIYYDADWLQALDTLTKSDLPSDSVLAHEFGHNIEIERADNPFFLNSKTGELTADCLAGFYVGYQEQSDQVEKGEVTNTFDLACSYGDQTSSFWFERGAHGTCGERKGALEQGINGFLSGLRPEQACPRF